MLLLLSLLALLTPPAPTTAARLRLAFGSCNKQFEDQSFWKTIQDRRPDSFLWLGDVVYADDRQTHLGPYLTPSSKKQLAGDGHTSSCIRYPYVCFNGSTPEHLRGLLGHLAADTHYRGLRESLAVPPFGIWDDHDMGLNDGDRRYVHRDVNQRIFLDFLGEKADSPRRRRRGLYGRKQLLGGRVVVHMLDVRFHRVPYGDDGPDRQTARDLQAPRDFLGEDQWAWLERSLRGAAEDPRVAVNIVATGLQVMRPFPGIGEVWGRHPGAKERLLDLLVGSRARGVVLLSGDVHMAQLSKAHCAATLSTTTSATATAAGSSSSSDSTDTATAAGGAAAANNNDELAPIFEVTSSGLTHAVDDMPAGPLSSVIVGAGLWWAGQGHLAAPTWFGRNFGELDIEVFDDHPGAHDGAGEGAGEGAGDIEGGKKEQKGQGQPASGDDGGSRHSNVVLNATAATGSSQGAVLVGGGAAARVTARIISLAPGGLLSTRTMGQVVIEQDVVTPGKATATATADPADGVRCVVPPPANISALSPTVIFTAFAGLLLLSVRYIAARKSGLGKAKVA